MTTHYKTLEEAQEAMKQEHLDAIDTDGTKFYYEKIIDEIVFSVWYSAHAAGKDEGYEAGISAGTRSCKEAYAKGVQAGVKSMACQSCKTVGRNTVCGACIPNPCYSEEEVLEKLKQLRK